MNWGRLITIVVITGVLCWIVIPVLGAIVLGGGAGVAITGVSILILWPLLIWVNYRRSA